MYIVFAISIQTESLRSSSIKVNSVLPWCQSVLDTLLGGLIDLNKIKGKCDEMPDY